MSSKVLAPLTGIVSILLIAAAIMTLGKPPSERLEGETAEELAAAYVAQADEIRVSVLLIGLAMVFFVYFASVLKAELDGAEGATGRSSRVAFAGALVFAIAFAIDLTLIFAMAESADEIDPIAIQALSALWDHDFVPFALGIVLFQSGVAISAFRHGGIPTWLAILSAIIAIAAVTPVGFFASFATAAWVAIASVVLMLQARKVEV